MVDVHAKDPQSSYEVFAEGWLDTKDDYKVLGRCAYVCVCV